MGANRPHRKVMISSTSLDLPEHRQQVIDACLRTNRVPLAMETLGAADGTAVQESLRLVDEAETYIGIFAHRYGFVPPGYDASITEIEYEHTIARGIPVLIFFMHDEHPLTAKDVETGPGAEKLRKLKEKIGLSRVAAFFKSKEDLRAHVIQSLSQQRDRDERRIQLHYVSEIPAPPEPYVAHPYVLLESRQLVGRREELNMLTDWVAKPQSRPYGSRLFHVVAIGGQGKSALTWHWSQQIAEQEMKPLAGRMWWSFYESDATFENFVIRALAYVSRRTIDEIRGLPVTERETALHAALDQEPHLIVLDGLERLLLAYSGKNVARLQDDTLDAETANYVAAAYGLPPSAAQSFTGQHRLRLTADPRVGLFLRRLTHVRSSRILISTRLYPADLQTTAQGEPSAACFAYFLPGLSDDDALDLWRTFGAKASRETMLPLLKSFDKHPLLIQALSSVVSHDRRAVGDFDHWRVLHPGFNPFPLLHAQRKAHVLSYALSGMDERQLRVLQTIAGFRMPTTYETLVALFVSAKGAAFSSEPELDSALAEIEDRGLLGWDRRANRYDLHPIVRGVVWGELDATRKREVVTTLHDHFAPIEIPEGDALEKIDDLTPAVELFHTLIELERFDDALTVYMGHLGRATQYRFSASRLAIELLERLFLEGIDRPPRIGSDRLKSFALTALALAYADSGHEELAVKMLRQSRDINAASGDDNNLATDLRNLSDMQRLTGDLRGAEVSARASLEIGHHVSDRFDKGVGFARLGLALAVRSGAPDAKTDALTMPMHLFEKSLQIFKRLGDAQAIGSLTISMAEAVILFDLATESHKFADQAWHHAVAEKYEANLIHAARLQATATLRSGVPRLSFAYDRLHHALTRARNCQLVAAELPTLIALAELHVLFAQSTSITVLALPLTASEHLQEARNMLAEVWDRAERGPYPLFQADAFNIVAQLERVAGDLDAAQRAATAAYEKAWCQGPPFAYAFGLYHAKKHLTELGVSFPNLPPYQESNYEPMPEGEIDPPTASEE